MIESVAGLFAMKNTGILNAVLLISLLAVLILPAYTMFFLTPAFTGFLISDTEKRLVRVAERMADSLLKEEKEVSAQSITPYFIRELGHIREAIDVWKVKVFTLDGAIVFSTDPVDIGQNSKKDFFGNVVSTGRPYSYISPKTITGIDGKPFEAQIIETYVPVVHNSKVIGVFEIYYDITATFNALDRLTNKAYVVLLGIVLLLLGAVLVSVTKARASMRAREAAENEIQRQKQQLEEQNRELALLHEQARDLSLRDHLTGLGNRRLMEIHFERAISLAHRYGKSLSLIMLDVDFFKKYNDTHGHPAGDEVLRRVAALIREHLREADAAFRYGGEEFLLLLPETGEDTALQVAEKLRLAVARNLDVTISLGVTDYRNGATAAGMIKVADDALYEAKQTGRNRVVRAQLAAASS